MQILLFTSMFLFSSAIYPIPEQKSINQQSDLDKTAIQEILNHTTIKKTLKQQYANKSKLAKAYFALGAGAGLVMVTLLYAIFYGYADYQHKKYIDRNNIFQNKQKNIPKNQKRIQRENKEYEKNRERLKAERMAEKERKAIIMFEQYKDNQQEYKKFYEQNSKELKSEKESLIKQKQQITNNLSDLFFEEKEEETSNYAKQLYSEYDKISESLNRIDDEQMLHYHVEAKLNQYNYKIGPYSARQTAVPQHL